MKVVIIDDDKLVAASLKTIVESDPEIEVLATGSSGQEAIDLYSEHHFDVSFSDELGNEHCSFDTSDESSTSISIVESEMITE